MWRKCKSGKTWALAHKTETLGCELAMDRDARIKLETQGADSFLGMYIKNYCKQLVSIKKQNASGFPLYSTTLHSQE